MLNVLYVIGVLTLSCRVKAVCVFFFWRTMTNFFFFRVCVFHRLTKRTTGMEKGNFDDGSSYIKALEAALDMGSFNAYAQKVLNGPVVCSSSSSSSSSDSSSSSSEESDSDEDSDETDAGKYLLIHLFFCTKFTFFFFYPTSRKNQTKATPVQLFLYRSRSTMAQTGTHE